MTPLLGTPARRPCPAGCLGQGSDPSLPPLPLQQKSGGWVMRHGWFEGAREQVPPPPPYNQGHPCLQQRLLRPPLPQRQLPLPRLPHPAQGGLLRPCQLSTPLRPAAARCQVSRGGGGPRGVQPLSAS